MWDNIGLPVHVKSNTNFHLVILFHNQEHLLGFCPSDVA